jgi:hypothetical protein
MLRTTRTGLGLAGVALALLPGCVELDITNNNQPDRERALAEAKDLEALIAGAFSVFFQGTHNTAHVVNLFPVYATEMTGVPVSGGGWSQSVEPRIPYENNPSIPGDSGPWGPRQLWTSLNQTASNIHDGLRTLSDRNVTLTEGGRDVTPRARAYAKLMQGWAWGYMGMLYDRSVVVPESQPIATNTRQQALESLLVSRDAQAMGLNSLDDAIALARQHSFTFPSASSSRLWFATPEPMTSTDLAQLGSTLAARILVLSARTPEERRQVDWNRVLEYTANGLERNFEVVLEPSFRSSLLYTRAATNTPGCANCYRLDNRMIGPADVSGAYQQWLALPVNDRTRFDIVTPDRRITGATPRSHGAYTFYRPDDNGFPAGRGLYFRSAYQWGRHEHRGYVGNTGTAVMASADENRLLRAEALLRTGDLQGAADLINVTRTRSHRLPDGVTYPGLPPVTAAGVSQSPTCVPRTDAGACGSLMDALRYERMLELAAYDAVRGYADSRGFGLLPEGSWLQLPIPGNELDLLGQGIYTFGGVGTEWGARYSPVAAP